MKPTWDWGPATNVDRIDHGYKPFPPGRGGRIPDGYTGEYATEADDTAAYAPSNGVSFISGKYTPTEEGREADTASNGSPPPDYNSVN